MPFPDNLRLINLFAKKLKTCGAYILYFIELFQSCARIRNAYQKARLCPCYSGFVWWKSTRWYLNTVCSIRFVSYISLQFLRTWRTSIEFPGYMQVSAKSITSRFGCNSYSSKTCTDHYNKRQKLSLIMFRKVLEAPQLQQRWSLRTQLVYQFLPLEELEVYIEELTSVSWFIFFIFCLKFLNSIVTL